MADFNTAQLPALCDTAIRDLAEVKTIGECLNIRNVMEAARVYAAKHKMAQEAQDACTKIVVLAERRIGQELIEAQKRGELARQSDGARIRDHVAAGNEVLPPTLEDIGLKRFEAHRFRQMAELDDTDVEEVVAEARERGKPVAEADFKRKAAAKRQATPTVEHPPEHVAYFSLWLRNGTRAIQQFADHRECMSLCGRYRVAIDAEEVGAIVGFLAALSAGLEADRGWPTRGIRSLPVRLRGWAALYAAASRRRVSRTPFERHGWSKLPPLSGLGYEALNTAVTSIFVPWRSGMRATRTVACRDETETRRLELCSPPPRPTRAGLHDAQALGA